MAAILNVKNPMEVRAAGLRALNDVLGYEGAQAFIAQYEGVGDFTAEKYDRPPQSFEEITARIKRASEEIRAEAEPDDENDDISAIFDGLRVDMTGHKFDRDAANDYD